MGSHLEPSWKKMLLEELKKPYVAELAAFIKQERSHKEVYPREDLVFNAFWQTPFEQTRVVLVGQDPYHGPGQAHGLCFSVPEGVSPPPSLKNIFKELHSDLGIEEPKHGSLESWAKQGVLLLNTTLTVCRAAPLSHHKHGWEEFTDAIIRAIVEEKEGVVFVLWGRNAQQKCVNVLEKAKKKQHVLMAAHPSPFSAHNGFLGCRHFSKVNTLLASMGQKEIDWSL